MSALRRRTSVLLSLLVVPSVLFFIFQPAIAEGAVLFRDDFNGAMEPGWTWIRENPSTWSLTGTSLRIELEYGDLWQGWTNNCRNLLVRPAPGTNHYTIELKLDATLVAPVNQAHILLYLNDDNYVRFGLSVSRSDGQIYRTVVHEVGGSIVHHVFSVYGSGSIFLRVVREGQGAQLYYSSDGNSWDLHYTISDLLFTNDRVGLVAFDGSEPSSSSVADYDYFQIACGTGDLQASFDFVQVPPGSPDVQFTDTSEGDPDEWVWDFDDGTTSTEQNPTHIFPAGCTEDFNVSLHVYKDNRACDDLVSDVVSVTPTATYPTPRAVLVVGWTDNDRDAAWFDNAKFFAKQRLQANGWGTIEVENMTYTQLSALLEDPSVRGVYIIAHGGKRADGTGEIALHHDEWNVDTYSPSEISMGTSGRQLDFVTVISCDQDRQQWTSSFNVQNDNVTMPRFNLWGQSEARLEALLTYWIGHGVSAGVCMDNGSQMISGQGSYVQALSSVSDCPSFLSYSYEDTVGGSSLYPVHTCASESGVLNNGSFSLNSPDSMFSINVRMEQTYQDSITLSATYYEAIPDANLFWINADRPFLVLCLYYRRLTCGTGQF